MSAQRKGKFLWRCNAALLSFAFLFFALGSKSFSFHQWFHGEGSACALIHKSNETNPCEIQNDQNDRTNQDDPNDRNDGGADPLLAFCQVGFLFQVEAKDILLAPFSQSNFVKSFLVSSFQKRILCAAAPRAPPFLV